MSDPEVKQKHSRKRQRNFLAKKLREAGQFRKKVHIDAKQKEKEGKWFYEQEEDDSFDS